MRRDPKLQVQLVNIDINQSMYKLWLFPHFILLYFTILNQEDFKAFLYHCHLYSAVMFRSSISFGKPPPTLSYLMDVLQDSIRWLLCYERISFENSAGKLYSLLKNKAFLRYIHTTRFIHIYLYFCGRKES